VLDSLRMHFADLPDPRMVNKCHHRLLDIIAIAVAATVAGADDWAAIETFVKTKAKWLQEWLAPPEGILPSIDTIKRVFRRLNAEAFEQHFIAWTQATFQRTRGQVIAIDGKTVRGVDANLHLVSAWATVNGISLGQYKVDDKSNEITAIPELLSLLTLEDAIVTIDAMGCQKAIADQIVEQKADYVLAVKKNQGKLYQLVEARFALTDDERFVNHPQPDYTVTEERRNGWVERRECWVLADDRAMKIGWRNCQTLVRIRSHREKDGEIQEETRYFISTLPPQPALLLGCVRAHWAIENSFHWVLDAVFKEDDNRTQERTTARNLASLRRIALNLLKRRKGKTSLRQMRYQAALNEDFLLDVLRP